MTDPVTWNERAGSEFTEDELLAPIVVGTIHGGGWNKNVYDGVHPATKASAHGVAGHTHLIADVDELGNNVARTMSAGEVQAEFGMEGLVPVVSTDEGVALMQLGNSGPAQLIFPRAEVLVSFCKVPVPFVPTEIGDIIRQEDLEAFQGTMELAELDYKFMKKAK